MTKVYPLFSSSSGNSTFSGTTQSGILSEAGVTCKRLAYALRKNGIDDSAVKAIFVTHEHSDHIQGLKVFTAHHKVPVIASEPTLEYLIKNDKISPDCRLIAMSDREVVGCGFSVAGFSTPHDAFGSMGYRIKTPEGKTLCICTDLGYVTEEIHTNLTGADLVLLESNYDENMLKNGPYSYPLKQRIASRMGHLSNVASAHEVRRLLESGTSQIVLGHLSRENNTPQIAKNTLLRELGDDFELGVDYGLTVAPVETEGLCVEV